MALIKTPSWKNSIDINRKITAQERKDITLFFNNLVLYCVLKINYTQFLKKAKGKEDDYGTKWKPLKKSTIDWKRKKNLTYSGRVAINIRTRELMNALKPGQFSNGVYIAGPNQDVRVTTKSIYFSPDIPYADDVDSVRAIIVEDLNALLEDAIQMALPRFKAYLRSKRL
jgi:hypothetical protein